MKRAIPRIPSCRLPIGKSREIAGSPAVAQEPRITAACNLQMSITCFLQLATSGSFTFLRKLTIS